MLKWMWRGLVTRLGLMAGEIPPSPHCRDPEVSKHFQVEPCEEHDLPPVIPRSDPPRLGPQAHPHPSDRPGQP